MNEGFIKPIGAAACIVGHLLDAAAYDRLGDVVDVLIALTVTSSTGHASEPTASCSKALASDVELESPATAPVAGTTGTAPPCPWLE